MIKFKFIFVLFFTFPVILFAQDSNKVLLISSYGTDYGWSNSIIDAINFELSKKNSEIEVNVEYLSSEQFMNPQNWVMKMDAILRNYHTNPPLAIVLISDEAWMAYQMADLTNFKDTPVILSAVKPHSISIPDFIKKFDVLQLSDFSPTRDLIASYNATGVIRKMNINAYIDLMFKFNPDTDGFVMVSDKRFYGLYTQLLFAEKVRESYPDYPLELFDTRFVNTDLLFSILPDIDKNKGFLLTSWLTGKHGFEYSKDYTYKKMEALLKTPIFITNNIGIETGYFIGGYYNSGSFWGDITTDIIHEVINGKEPKDVDVIERFDEECNINWLIYDRYKTSKTTMPSDVKYINKPIPFFVKYRNAILFTLIVVIMFVAVLVYVLVNNIKLKKAQKLTTRLMNEMQQTNIKLDYASHELMSALKKAEESDRLKSAFVANMSHEIRTPLNAIVGFSNIIIATNDHQEQIEAEEILKKNSDQLLTLISNILDISNIEAGAITLNCDEIDPSSICMDAVSMLEHKCKKGVKLYFEQPQKNVVMYTDYMRVMQIIIIFTNNAIKFTNKGQIKLGYKTVGQNKIEFYVEDTGIGIPAEKSDIIFERFVKLDNYVEGTGLGLSIAKAIIKIFNGEIGVRTEEGKGSTFWFRIDIFNSSYL